MDARGLVADHGFDRVREDHFAFAAPAVDGAAEFFFAHFTFHIICASKENNADNLPRLNHSYYLDRRPKRPAADRGLKSTDRPLQISAARPAGDQFHERSAVRQHQCVGPNDNPPHQNGKAMGAMATVSAITSRSSGTPIRTKSLNR